MSYFWHCSGGSADAILWTDVYGSQKGLWYHAVIWPLYWLGRRSSNGLYWFRYRYVRRHQYNIIRTDLPPGYYDEDIRMLHACFAILESYVDWHGGDDELEKFTQELRDQPDRNAPEGMNTGQINLQTEAVALYRWWKVDRPADRARRDKIMNTWHDGRGKPGTKERWDALNEIEQRVDNDEQTMLHRLIEIRPGLW